MKREITSPISEANNAHAAPPVLAVDALCLDAETDDLIEVRIELGPDGLPVVLTDEEAGLWAFDIDGSPDPLDVPSLTSDEIAAKIGRILEALSGGVERSSPSSPGDDDLSAGELSPSEYAETLWMPQLWDWQLDHLAEKVNLGKSSAARLADAFLPPQERASHEANVREAIPALRVLVEVNLGLVVRLAWEFRDSGVPIMELVQEGIVGLIKAARAFNWTYRRRFMTWAVGYIRESIGGLVAKEGQTRNSASVCSLDALVCCSAFPLAVENQNGVLIPQTPCPVRSRAERYSNMAVADDDFERPPCLCPSARANQATPGMTADLTMIGLWRETAAFVQEVGGSLRSEAIDTLLASLSERERVVLQGRFGLADGQEHTLQELADELGLTRERIRQIQRSGICRLVVLFRDPGFDYLAREYQRRPPHS